MFVLAAVCTVVVVVTVLLDLRAVHDGEVVGLLVPGEESAAAPAIAEDFDAELPPGVGHDGQYFYAAARQPMHLADAAADLDRPRYRLQRPMLSWLGWLLHPSGGGPGLVWALAAVNVAALFAASAGVGLLSLRLGGPAWPALALLGPGSWFAVRMTTADVLGVGLLFATLLLLVQGRTARACSLSVLGVLAREATVLPLAGFAFGERKRAAAWATTLGVAAALAWGYVVRVAVPGTGAQVTEIGLPFRGVLESVPLWLEGDDVAAAIWLAVALLLAGVASVTTRLRHPLAWPLVAQLALTVVLVRDVLQPMANCFRATLPLWLLTIVVLATPDARSSTTSGPDRRPPVAAGPDVTTRR